MKKTVDFLFCVLMMLGVTLVIALIPTERDAAIYTDTVRLHILANSDSDSDQELKLKIRDRLLNEYGAQLSVADSAEDAISELSGMTDEIEDSVCAWLSEYGESYGCRAVIGVEWYDTREYEDFTLPRGYYTSLRVMLGEGEGKNWWCVMYPPLCLDIATEDAPRDDAVSSYSKEEYALIKSEGYAVKFKILEVFSDAFSKNS